MMVWGKRKRKGANFSPSLYICHNVNFQRILFYETLVCVFHSRNWKTYYTWIFPLYHSVHNFFITFSRQSNLSFLFWLICYLLDPAGMLSSVTGSEFFQPYIKPSLVHLSAYSNILLVRSYSLTFSPVPYISCGCTTRKEGYNRTL